MRFEVVFGEHSCLLWLETELMRAVRLDQNSKTEVKDAKKPRRAEGNRRDLGDDDPWVCHYERRDTLHIQSFDPVLLL